VEEESKSRSWTKGRGGIEQQSQGFLDDEKAGNWGNRPYGEEGKCRLREGEGAYEQGSADPAICQGENCQNDV